MTIVLYGWHYKLVYQPQSCSGCACSGCACSGCACSGCAFEGSHEGCRDANRIVDCGEHVFIPADCMFIRTRSGWYIHRDTGEVIDHDLNEDFGPAPIHIEGLSAYWYLDSFGNPVRESCDD